MFATWNDWCLKKDKSVKTSRAADTCAARSGLFPDVFVRLLGKGKGDGDHILARVAWRGIAEPAAS